MKLLVDTHVLLWWLADAEELPADQRRLIADSRNMAFVSAATVWEIEIKRALGKLRITPDWLDALDAEEFRPLPVTWQHARRVARLPDIHRDPFDRLLVAQAMEEGLLLLTCDETVRRYGVSAVGKAMESFLKCGPVKLKRQGGYPSHEALHER